MAATSPTCSVEIGIGKSIGRGDVKGIGIGNTWMTERYEVDSSMATVTITLYICIAAASLTRFVEIGISRDIVIVEVLLLLILG